MTPLVHLRIVKHELSVFPELCDALVISAGDMLADGRYGNWVCNGVIVVRIVLRVSFEYPDSERKNHIPLYLEVHGTIHNVSIHQCPHRQEPPCEPH